MAGINLSQSLQEKQTLAKGKFFDRSFVFTMIGFALLLGVFGGLRWYVGSLDKKMLELDQTITEKTASLRGKEVNRIMDFSRRLETINKHLTVEPDPTAMFRQLEMHTLLTIQLTGYEYDREVGEIKLHGSSNTLKEVAQQMLAFKDVDGVDKITVENIDYGTDGKVKFSFKLLQAKPVVEPSS